MTTPSGLPSDERTTDRDDDEALALGMFASCREVVVGFGNLDPRLQVPPFAGRPPWRDR